MLLSFILLFVSLWLGQSHAQSTSIDNGLGWLSSSQNLDGSWGGTDDSIVYTAEVLNALKALNATSQNYIAGINWLFLQQDKITIDELSRQIIALNGNINTDQLIVSLLSYKKSDGGWGFSPNSLVSNPWDTALALQALKAINYPDQNVIQSAINYLLSTQNTDGGFGFYQGDESNVYMTAMVSSILQQFPQTTSIATAINEATTYLIAHQNTDGGFGEGGGTPPLQSTVFETAYAYLALISETTDATVLGNAINYITTTQLPNGSWNDDPYSTALALRALANVKPNLSITSNDITFSNPTPTAGETITITANVKNAGPSQAYGVSVQFYDGDPSSGGALIEETTIASISAYGTEQTSISHTIPTASSKTIFIKIDPLNLKDFSA